MKLKILKVEYLDQFKEKNKINIVKEFKKLEKIEIDFPKFDFYTSVASVYSSKIEGENIDIDSYLKHRFFNRKYQPNYTKKADDLFSAYKFASENKLNQKNLLQCHKLLSKNLVPKSERGIFRVSPEFIINESGNIVYVAADAKIVKSEVKKLFDDIAYLFKKELTYEEVFYFASMIHLIFVEIHPFSDGNGRTSRLLEKWFISQKLGLNAWFLRSELYYYSNIDKYYKNINIGIEYDELNYDKCIPFLLMLPVCLTAKF
jgi:Fic family protein